MGKVLSSEFGVMQSTFISVIFVFRKHFALFWKRLSPLSFFLRRAFSCVFYKAFLSDLFLPVSSFVLIFLQCAFYLMHLFCATCSCLIYFSCNARFPLFPVNYFSSNLLGIFFVKYFFLKSTFFQLVLRPTSASTTHTHNFFFNFPAVRNF